MLEKAKTKIIGLVCATLAFLFSFVSVLYYADPYNGSWVTFLLFYSSVFFLITGTMTLIGLGLRQRYFPNLFNVNLLISARQATLIAILVLSSFALQSQRLLFWWVELSIIVFFIVLEIFISS